MKSVVITGSTRGIGLGLARAFAQRGCQVMVSGRTAAAVDNACEALARELGDTAQLEGTPCDVTRFGEVQALWNAAATGFGKIDIWINNAGMVNADAHDAFAQVSPESLAQIVEVNLLGAMHGARVALAGMRAQGFGQLYNVEGFGAGGGQFRVGLTPYGTTKCAVGYLSRALAFECRGSPVRVGGINPGIVVTDLLLAPYVARPDELAKAKRVFNILADRVETIAPWIAARVLANTKNGVNLAWLTRSKALWRFATAGLRQRDLFAPASL